MSRFYCDYCDTYLTHDSFHVRKQHLYGWKHRENFKNYYEQFVGSYLPPHRLEQQQQYQQGGQYPAGGSGYTPQSGPQSQGLYNGSAGPGSGPVGGGPPVAPSNFPGPPPGMPSPPPGFPAPPPGMAPPQGAPQYSAMQQPPQGGPPQPPGVQPQSQQGQGGSSGNE